MGTETKSLSRSQQRKADWQGQNWLRPARRLALYLRDGLACVWCQVGIEDHGTILTLDHVIPYNDGGTHENANLVTSCHRCNSSRSDRTVAAFAKAVAAYVNRGVQPAEIRARVRAAVKRPVDVAEAKAIIARRGSCKRALDAGGK